MRCCCGRIKQRNRRTERETKVETASFAASLAARARTVAANATGQKQLGSRDGSARIFESKLAMPKMRDTTATGHAFKTNGVDTNGTVNTVDSKRALAKMLDTMVAVNVFNSKMH